MSKCHGSIFSLISLSVNFIYHHLRKTLFSHNSPHSPSIYPSNKTSLNSASSSPCSLIQVITISSRDCCGTLNLVSLAPVLSHSLPSLWQSDLPKAQECLCHIHFHHNKRLFLTISPFMSHKRYPYWSCFVEKKCAKNYMLFQKKF